MSNPVRALALHLVLATVLLSARLTAQDCVPQWDQAKGLPGVNSSVNALAFFDDGQAPAVYAGGLFNMAGNITANRIARWNGSQWSALGTGITGVPAEVRALAAHNGPSNRALYVGGKFTSAGPASATNVARWNGSTWSALADGLNDTVFALLVSGDGSDVIAGGAFTMAGQQSAAHVARFRDGAWSPLGSGFNARVLSLAFFDDASGSGPALVAGGDFTQSGTTAVSRVARWNGTAWQPMGLGLNGSVLALTVFDDGSGPMLIAGGDFTFSGSTSINRVARWNGTAWQPLGVGTTGQVRALKAFDDGTDAGPALFAAGTFTGAGGGSALRVARWNGLTWSALGSGLNNPASALLAVDKGPPLGPSLYVGGTFSTAGGQSANFVARWNGCFIPPGDFNLDGVVDLDDYAFLHACLDGPSLDPLPGCQDADLNDDGAVDLLDIAEFQAYFGVGL